MKIFHSILETIIDVVDEFWEEVSKMQTIRGYEDHLIPDICQ